MREIRQKEERLGKWVMGSWSKTWESRSCFLLPNQRQQDDSLPAVHRSPLRPSQANRRRNTAPARPRVAQDEFHLVVRPTPFLSCASSTHPCSHDRHSPAYYAQMYKERNLRGAHVIKLGPGNDEAAKEALREWPGNDCASFWISECWS